MEIPRFYRLDASDPDAVTVLTAFANPSAQPTVYRVQLPRSLKLKHYQYRRSNGFNRVKAFHGTAFQCGLDLNKPSKVGDPISPCNGAGCSICSITRTGFLMQYQMNHGNFFVSCS